MAFFLYVSANYFSAETYDISGGFGSSGQSRSLPSYKRMGGGFGGKETRSAVLAAPAAVASFRLQRPVRCMLDQDEDMMSTGIRHPFLARYKVGFDATGKLTALDD